MTDQDYRDSIAQGWFEKAEDAFEEARILLREKKTIGCVNRLYYAVFYATSAACAKEGKEYGKHSMVRAALHRDFVNTGRVPESCGNTFDDLFEDRQQGDYKPGTRFEMADIERLFENARTFIDYFKTMTGLSGKSTKDPR